MAKKYKIKLASGRIVGPLDLDRIALLIKRDQILGTEEAREHPRGEWKDINQYTDLADLIIAKLEGKSKSTLIRGDATKTAVDPGGVTVKLDETGKPLPGMEAVTSGQAISELSDVSLDSGFLTEQEKAILDERKAKDLPEDEDLQADAKAELKPAHVKLVDDDDASKGEGDLDDDGEKTVLASNPSFKLATQGKMDFEDPTQHGLTSSAQLSTHAPMRDVTNEETVIFQGRGRAPSLNDLVPRKSSKLKRGAIIAIFIALALEVLIPEKEEEITWRVPPFKPALPAFSSESVDAAQSELLFKASLKYYVQDTVSGYKNAAKNLLRAASLDNNNVKAMALLASCYLNLIDSSNKDDKYFQVISSVIERSRAKSIDLQETVIADVEFYLTVGRGAAAQKRIVDFTSTHTTYGVEMFYYLAYVFYKRGNYRDAAKFVAQIPEEKIQIPRIYYLRGQIAEKLGTLEEARQQYLKALKVYRNHAKSRLTLADIYRRQSELLKAESHLNFLKTNPHLLSPEDLARSYYLSSLVNDLKKNVQQALGDIEVAVKLDPNNHDYMLELFTLRYRAGDKVDSIRKKARMYYFLGEGEKLYQEGKHQDALIAFMDASHAYRDSALPYSKIGDTFMKLNDIPNAKINYGKAAKISADDTRVLAKYIKSLILSYEWENAEKQINRLKKYPHAKSSVDKLRGDVFFHQGQLVQALTFYKRAMDRDSIDSDVYVSYARALMTGKAYDDAPFFFALARRFDPLNVEAILGTATCIAEKESIEQAIIMLQEEVDRSEGLKPELLTAIAEFQVKKGQYDEAQNNVKQAMALSPDYALPWKVQAEIFLSQEERNKQALEEAAQAYKSYSDRNPSDPSGYLKRHEIFIKQKKFKEALEELDKIYGLYPRYPNLHYYKGNLYSLAKRPDLAVEEFKRELANHPNNTVGLIAMGKEMVNLGDYRKGLEYFTKAMAVDPRNAEAKHQAGFANFLLNNPRGAIALYTAAIRIDPGNPVIYKRLGLAFRSVGDPLNAAENFRKYLELAPDAEDRADFEQYQ